MRAAVICIILSVFALLPMAAIAGPTITIYTDNDTYATGDTIEVSLSAKNFDEAMSVAVYIGLLGPDGDIYTLQFEGWSDRVDPWIPEIWVPSPFNLNRTPFWSFDVPCLMPPIADEDLYHFVAGLTRSGTFEFVCDVSYAPFEVRCGSPSDYYVDAEYGDDSDDGSEGAPWETISHALDAVTGTEDYPVTIHVAAGTYAASTNGETFPLDMESWVSLSGEDQDTTILDAEGEAYHVIFCDSVDNLTIENLTIAGGNANGTMAEDTWGGGIDCWSSSPDILNNTITHNDAAKGGGGIYCNKSSPTIQGNMITNNSGPDGGGISCLDHCSPTILENTISENSGNGGGGIYFTEECSGSIQDNEITDNSAASGGGGIECMYYSSPIIQNNLIVGNSAGSYGGAGIRCSDSSLPRIVSNTIIDNSTASGGGGIYCLKGSVPTIVDCIIGGNGDDLYGCSASYSCIQDLDPGAGNIYDHPLFTAGPLGYYYLDPDSPCIDAGSQSAEDAGLSERTTQADGTPDTGTVDMGFHYPIE